MFQNSTHIEIMSRIHCWMQQYLKTLIQKFHHGFLFSANCSGNWPSLSLFLLWGVLHCQLLRKGAGYYNLLWQVSLSGATIVRVHVVSPTCCPTPTQSLEDSPTGLCLYLRLLCFLPAVKKVLFNVNFFYNSIGDQPNMIKIICGKIIIRGSNGLFCYLSERN